MARQPAWPELVRGAASDVEIRPSDVRGHRLPAVRFNEFATVALGALLCPRGARAYYELELREVGYYVPQFGVATRGFPRGEDSAGIGVGDNAASWGVDGGNKARWHNGGEEWGGEEQGEGKLERKTGRTGHHNAPTVL